MTPLSALAENFIPRKISRKQSTPQVPTDNELDRSFAKTGSIKRKTQSSGPAGTGAGGPVVSGAKFRTVTEVAGASGPAGTGAGGPVIAGTRFLAVAEVYAPFEEMKGDLQGDIGRVDLISKIPEEETGSHLLEHSGVVEGTAVSGGIRKRNIPESLEIYTDPARLGRHQTRNR